MIIGDGDCGEAVEGVRHPLDSDTEQSGAILSFLFSIIDSIDDMSRALSTIFGILLSSGTVAFG